MKVFSEVELTKKVITDGEEKRVYTGTKLNAYHVTLEGFKLFKMLSPSFGASIDSFFNSNEGLSLPQTFTSFGLMFHENFSDEQFMELFEKMVGSLKFDGEKIIDWNEHFTKYPQRYPTSVYLVSKGEL